jgi:hypothetical protein
VNYTTRHSKGYQRYFGQVEQIDSNPSFIRHYNNFAFKQHPSMYADCFCIRELALRLREDLSYICIKIAGAVPTHLIHANTLNWISS